MQHEHPEQKKSVSPKRPQAQREAQAYAGQGVVRKILKATLAMPLGRVIILSPLPYDRTAKFRCGFLAAAT